jgi:hypothetical protein
LNALVGVARVKFLQIAQATDGLERREFLTLLPAGATSQASATDASLVEALLVLIFDSRTVGDRFQGV